MSLSLFSEATYDVGAAAELQTDISVISLENGRKRRQAPGSTVTPVSSGQTSPAATTPTTSPDLSEFNIVHVSLGNLLHKPHIILSTLTL